MGALLIAKGQEVTSTLTERLKNIVELGEVAEPIKVVIPWAEGRRQQRSHSVR